VLNCSQFGALSSGSYALAPGQSYTIAITVIPLVVGNTGIHASVSSTSVDANPNNNDGCVTTTICNLAFHDTLVVTPSGTAAYGSTVTFSVTLGNTDTAAANNLAMSAVTSGLQLTSLTSPLGSTSVAGATWNIGTLGASSSTSLTAQGTVTQSGANAPVTFSICFTSSDRIPSLECGNAQLTTPKLLAVKSTTTPTVAQGGMATYILQAINGDSVTHTGVVLTDTFPAGFTSSSTSVTAHITSISTPTTYGPASSAPAAGSGWKWTGSTNINNPTATLQFLVTLPSNPPYGFTAASITCTLSTAALVNYGIAIEYYSVSAGAWVVLESWPASATAISYTTTLTIPVADLPRSSSSFVQVTGYGNPVTPTGSWTVSAVSLTVTPIILVSSPTVSITCSGASPVVCQSQAQSLAPGQTLELSLSATVPSAASLGTVTNQVTVVSALQTTPIPASVPITIVSNSPLEVTLLVNGLSSTTLYPGDTFSYVIMVSASSSTNNVQVSLPNPDSSTVTFPTSAASATFNGNPITMSSPLNLAALLQNAQNNVQSSPMNIIITIPAQILTTTTATQLLTMATAFSTTATASPQQASHTITIISPFSFTKTTMAPTITIGSAISYTITAANSLSTTSSSAITYSFSGISDTAPTGVTFTAGSCTFYSTSSSTITESSFSSGSIWGDPVTPSAALSGGAVHLSTAIPSVSWTQAFPVASGTYNAVTIALSVQRNNAPMALSVTTASGASGILYELPADTDTSLTALSPVDFTLWITAGQSLTFSLFIPGASGAGTITIDNVILTTGLSNVPSVAAAPTISAGSQLNIAGNNLANQQSLQCTFTGLVSSSAAPVVINQATITVTAPYSATLQAIASVQVLLAVNDTVSVVENQGFLVPILSNDLGGAYIDPYTIATTACSAGGTTTVTGFGSVFYQPLANYYGQDSFQYTISDWEGAYNSTATVSITIDAQVIANSDSVTAFIGMPVTFSQAFLLSNDLHTSASTVFSIYTQPTTRTCTYNSTSVTCTGSAVNDTMLYRLCNPTPDGALTCEGTGYNNCATARVFISVLANPQLVVKDSTGVITIPNGDTTPSSSDGTSFGSTSVGSPVTHMFELCNNGGVPLVISSVTLSDSSDYSLPSGSPATVAVGACQSLSVQYNPQIIGTQPTTVTVNSNDPATPAYTFQLSGTASAQQWGVFGGAGFVHQITSFASRVDTVTQTIDGTNLGTANPGAATLSSVFEIEFAGSMPVADTATLSVSTTSAPQYGTFSISSSPLTVPTSGASFTVTYTANPSSTLQGTPTGTVTVTMGTVTETFNVAAVYQSRQLVVKDSTGVITIPNGDTTPSSSDGTSFGSTSVGSPVTHVFELCDPDSLALSVSSIALSNTVDFTIVPPAPSTVAPGSCANLTISFSPTLIGTRTSSVTITTNDPTNPSYVFDISGTGRGTINFVAFESQLNMLDLTSQLTSLLGAAPSCSSVAFTSLPVVGSAVLETPANCIIDYTGPPNGFNGNDMWSMTACTATGYCGPFDVQVTLYYFYPTQPLVNDVWYMYFPQVSNQ